MQKLKYYTIIFLMGFFYNKKTDVSLHAGKGNYKI